MILFSNDRLLIAWIMDLQKLVEEFKNGCQRRRLTVKEVEVDAYFLLQLLTSDERLPH